MKILNGEKAHNHRTIWTMILSGIVMIEALVDYPPNKSRDCPD